MRGKLVFAGVALGLSISAQAQDIPDVERAQFVAQMDADFVQLDANGDGTVTREEILTNQRQAAQSEALRQNRAVFETLDIYDNAMLSPEEFAQLANPQAVPIDAGPLLTQYDTNGDGAITLIEYRVATQASFDSIDADRNGTITALEMRGAGIVR